MSETSCCPYCGLPLRHAPDGIKALYREVQRIADIAEGRAADDDARRIADLQRQVAELRATVARLRAPGVVPIPAPSDRRAG